MSDETLVCPAGDPHDEQLRLENDMLRMKLRAEFGTDLELLPDLSPQVQHVILKHVYSLEQMTHLKVAKIPVYKKIGSPPFIPCNELEKDAIPAELDRLVKLLRSHHIIFEVLATYEPGVIYRFVTEEFFRMEINDFPSHDWYIHFCYEQFHPNDEFNLRKYTELFIEELMDKEVHEDFNPLYGEMLGADNNLLTGKEAYHRILEFSEHFKSFKLQRLDLHTVSLGNDRGLTQFHISFDGMLADGEVVTMEGEGEFHFVRARSGAWNIRQIKMPGLRI